MVVNIKTAKKVFAGDNLRRLEGYDNGTRVEKLSKMP